MKLIPLTQGQITVVDDCDYPGLAEYKWFALKCGNYFYAMRGVHVKGTKNKTVLVAMHRQILGLAGADKQVIVDHIDRNGLNNQRANLRVCTSRQNTFNAKKRAGCTSVYRGVSKNKNDGLWWASIRDNYKLIHLGRYKTEQEAAMAYNKKAKSIFGAFANINEV